MHILTFGSNGEQSWTNPPTRDIDEVWQFIYNMYDYPIVGFLFGDELRFDAAGNIINEELHENPKTTYKQEELF